MGLDEFSGKRDQKTEKKLSVPSRINILPQNKLYDGIAYIAAIPRDNFLNIVSTRAVYVERVFSELLDTNYTDNYYWPFGILTEKAMVRIPREKKKKNRRERESSFLLRASIVEKKKRVNCCLGSVKTTYGAWKRKKQGILKMRTP